jgi:8-oxo-dGTP pyrophosphatase MutT (NUDIX family)
MAKEFFGTGDSAIRDDKPMTEREVVVVAMKHPTEEKYLCVKNRKFGWIDFVMGGIEGEEKPIEAAKREVVEETGYDDFGELKELDEVCYDNFYAAHKDVNRHIAIHTVYGSFESLRREERSEEEKEIAEVLWISAEELAEKLTQEAHKYIWGRVKDSFYRE